MARTSFLHMIGIAALTVLCYMPVFQASFVNLDDPSHVLENPYVQDLNRTSVQGMFRQTVHRIYIPLTTLSFSIEHHFFGFNPFVYHLDNVLLHIAVSLLLYALALRMKLGESGAFWSGMLFALHPVHVESVAWVTERKDVLYALFYMLTLHQYVSYIRRPTIHAYFGVFICAGLSLLAKPMAVSLVPVLFLMDWYFKRKIVPLSFLDKLPIGLLSAGIAWISYSGVALIPETGNDSWLLKVWSIQFYISKLVWPVELSPFYAIPKPFGVTQPEYFWSLIVLGLIMLGIYRFRNCRLWIFAWGYFILSMFFLLGTHPTHFNVVADRFIYLPSLGFLLWAGEWLARIRTPVSKSLLPFVLVLMLGILTTRQSLIWTHSLHLWNHVIELHPDFFIAYDSRGCAYRDLGNYDQALRDFDRAIALRNNFPQSYNNRGMTYGLLGRPEEALADFNRALELDPGFAPALYNRSLIVQGENS